MNRFLASQRGWSLPFIWIFLILVIAIVFLFFSTLRWIGLVILGLFAVSWAIVAISTLFQKKEAKGPKGRN